MGLNTTDEWLDKKAIQEICEPKDPRLSQLLDHVRLLQHLRAIAPAHRRERELVHARAGLRRPSVKACGSINRAAASTTSSARFLRPFRGSRRTSSRRSDAQRRCGCHGCWRSRNHYVFHEIGYAVAGLTEWYEKRLTTHAHDSEAKWMAAWLRHRADIKPFRQADETFGLPMRRGCATASNAISGRCAPKPTRHAKRSSCCMATSCWRRMSSGVSIRSCRLRLIRLRNISWSSVTPTRTVSMPPATFRVRYSVGRARRGRCVSQSAVMRWIADVYAGLLTQHVMALDVPIGDRGDGSILLGRGVARDVANTLSQRRRIDDSN